MYRKSVQACLYCNVWAVGPRGWNHCCMLHFDSVSIFIPCCKWACLTRNPIHVSVFMYLCNTFVTEGCHLQHHDCGATCGMFMSVICTILICTRIFHDTECTYMYLEGSQKISIEYYKRHTLIKLSEIW
jgi:hypothetical protein